MGFTDETNKVSTVSNESKTVRKVKFKLKDSDNGVLLKIHHTVSQNRRLLRIRFVNACFSHDNEKLFAVDHRSSIFIFSLTGLKYWVLENCIVSVTAIESIPNTNQVLLGNKEGLVVSIDTDTGIELMRLKAHHTRIERISFPSWFAKQHQKQETQHPQTNSHPSRKQGARCLEKASDSHGTENQQTAKSSKNTLMPMFLVTASECAKLYDARNFVELHQLNYGTADSMKRIEHLQWAPRAGLLLGCGLDGRLWLWKTDFKLAKELNLLKMRTSYLNKFQMEYVTVTCDEEQPLLCEGQDESKRKVDRVIQSMTADGRTKGFVKSAQFTLGGKFLMLNCMDHSLIILNCDSWQVCKILALSGLFITHFEIVHVDRQHSSRAKAQEFLMLVKNVESDLLLMNLEDGSKSYIVHSPESKCYKFRLSNNSKMLANVLKSGEILLHNLEFHSCALKANKLQQSAVVVSTPTGKTHPRPSKTTASTSIIVQRQRRTTGEPATNSNLATPSNASLYTVAPAATVASSGSTSTGQIVSVFRKESKLKIEKRLEDIHDKISKTLVKNRLLPILKEFGEYPEKHRSTIWRTVLELPHNVNCFNALLLQGYHSCVADYDRKFSSYDSRMVRNMKKIVSCLANWSAVFAQCDFVPFFVHPFIRLYPNDSLTCFETVATVLLNHCQLWFEFAPLEPFNYLGMIENILCEYEPKLMNFYRTRHISSRVYGLTLMETAFAENFDANQWLRLWDHILSNEPYFMLFFVVAYNAGHRTTIINCTNEKDIEVFFHGPSLIDIGKLLKRTYDVAERCTESIHPKYYMKSFVPLNGIAANEVKSSNLASRHKPNQCYKPNQLRNLDNKNPVKSTYSKFNNFPKQLVDVRAGEINCLKAEQQRLEAKIVEMEKLEHMLKDRMVDNLIQEEHDKRMKEVERKYEEALVGEEQRIEMQRKLLLLHKKQLRERENEILTESRNSLLRQSAAAREYELETLLKTLQQERQREEMDFMFAEEDIKQREMELLARRYDTNTKLTDDGSLEQRYQQAIQQLDRQKQRLYEEIERVSYYDSTRSLAAPSYINKYTDGTYSITTAGLEKGKQTQLKDYERNLKHLDSQLETLLDVQEK